MRPTLALRVMTAAATSLLLTGGGRTSSVQTVGGQLAYRNVIVILSDQLAAIPAEPGHRAERAAAISAAQAPVLSHLQASGATHIQSFSLINAVAANVSAEEEESLATHPLVRAIMPERAIKLPPVVRRPAVAAGGGGSGAGVTDHGSTAPLCDTLEPEALQLVNGAFTDPATPQAQRILDANGKWITGEGVKVAFLADGLDPTIPGFLRPDGTSVFSNLVDFSGDPEFTPTYGGEAFGDASSIAAQDDPKGHPLRFDISQYVAPSLGTLPTSPCNIRIRGLAPEASLVSIKVFSEYALTTNTRIVQAIEYAVMHDEVDVINESFATNAYPDNDDDPVSLANHEAVRAGVTVVAGSGDSGYNGTVGSPSTDPWVIEVGASTQFRVYSQLGYGANYFATNGWVSNNISAASSGGFALVGARMPDVVAPGDVGWALCAPVAEQDRFQGCPGSIQVFGGTSEAAPFTAAAAALVIQAYRSAHGGHNPTPALVKQIITSTATDLGAPPSEQGAGLINALAAVHAALSVSDQYGGTLAGSGVLNSASSASFTDLPGTPQTFKFALTNTGSKSQQLLPSLQALGPPIAGATTTVTLSASSPVFPGVDGAPNQNYQRVRFNVPEGAEHLDAAIAWQAPESPFSVAALALIDPTGRQAAFSQPQGLASGYGHVDVGKPAPGTWSAVIFTNPSTGRSSSAGRPSASLSLAQSRQRA